MAAAPEAPLDVYDDYEALSRAAARAVTDALDAARANNRRLAVALAGGSTPDRLYALLARHLSPKQWAALDVFWGDERCVPYVHPHSNAGHAYDVLLRHAPVPPAQVHRMPVYGTPADCATAYDAHLHRAFDRRTHTFDLVLLGLGGDGHTASLFPETLDTALAATAWVQAVHAPPRHAVADRLTCTLPALNAAREALFLVSGDEKREALAAVRAGDRSLPATHVAPAACRWLVDRAAAGP
ncbi:6-phosphogluconolactonase [Salisaeta longa]|uniref:6-phosphogluconolactonase n=1 Tax=Salisaeta longa TaxID=503170 RepID=UPI0003B42692|nr:6-phosphogluconolactonase [Salisaeta longa]